jgi:hypothetical protein
LFKTIAENINKLYDTRGSIKCLKVKGPAPLSFKCRRSVSLLGRSNFFRTFNHLSINDLYLFNCFGLHCCEKIWLKVVSDAEDFGALKGIWCLRKFCDAKCFTWWFHWCRSLGTRFTAQQCICICITISLYNYFT